VGRCREGELAVAVGKVGCGVILGAVAVEAVGGGVVSMVVEAARSGIVPEVAAVVVGGGMVPRAVGVEVAGGDVGVSWAWHCASNAAMELDVVPDPISPISDWGNISL
jgi:hypothetical protein